MPWPLVPVGGHGGGLRLQPLPTGSPEHAPMQVPRPTHSGRPRLSSTLPRHSGDGEVDHQADAHGCRAGVSGNRGGENTERQQRRHHARKRRHERPDCRRPATTQRLDGQAATEGGQRTERSDSAHRQQGRGRTRRGLCAVRRLDSGSAARRYARITVPQHTWVRTPDTAKAVAEAMARRCSTPGRMAPAIPRMPSHCRKPIPTSPVNVPTWIRRGASMAPFHNDCHLGSASMCSGITPSARSKSSPNRTDRE